ncbi:hypothetical protein LCGC14_1568870 [marine sediment metagenome]|uniref:Uncharacterized protein n=1 Tax=marine sediment metagenome TaxID=412755 RepID=A0A0F9LKW1_9ZZZZ
MSIEQQYALPLGGSLHYTIGVWPIYMDGDMSSRPAEAEAVSCSRG